MKLILLSTDVILDYLLDKEEKSQESVKVIGLCKDGKIKGWVLEDTISRARQLSSDVMDGSETAKRVKELLEFLGVLSLNKKSILKALSDPYQDYDKVIQVEAVRAARLDFLVAKNVSDYKEKEDIKILTPKWLLEELVKGEVNSIPALDLKRELHAYLDEVQGELSGVVFSTSFILGDDVRKFEEGFAKYCNAEYCIGVASGSDALLISLMAVDIGPGDAVITTPYTFFATAGSITRLFALPIFVDIDPATYNIDVGQIEKLIEEGCDWDGENLWVELPNLKPCFWNPEYFPIRRRIRAIIPVHLFGQTADMEKIMKIANRYNLCVIEDAAQAHGADCWVRGDNGYGVTDYGSNYDNMSRNKPTPKRIGSIGHLGCFSVFPTKNLGCWGDGGAVTTNDKRLAEKVRILRVHGSKPKYYHKSVGINSRLDTIQATVLLAKLPHLDRWIEKRQEVARRYMDLLPQERVTLPEVAGYTARHVWNQFVVRINGNGDRNEVQKGLKEKGIGTGVYYPLPLHLQECFSYIGYKEGDFPNSERAAKETLALPMYPELEGKEQEETARKLREIL